MPLGSPYEHGHSPRPRPKAEPPRPPAQLTPAQWFTEALVSEILREQEEDDALWTAEHHIKRAQHRPDADGAPECG